MSLFGTSGLFASKAGALGQSSSPSEELVTSPGSFTFTGPAARFVLDNEGTWFPLLANMPGFAGARGVINWCLNSDTPGSPTAWSTVVDSGGTFSAVTDTDANGNNVYALQEVNAGATAYGPYIYGDNGYYTGTNAATLPGLIPPGVIFATRFEIKSVSGATAVNIYQRNKDSNISPTESGNGTFTISGAYRKFTSTFEQDAQYQAFGFRVHPSPAAITTLNVSRPMLEDVSGRKGSLIPSEYVPCGASASWKWFSTARATSRTNSSLLTTALTMAAQKDPVNANSVTGELTDSTGAPVSAALGLFMEPAATNLVAGWNVPLRAGWLKTSGAITGRSGAVGVASGATTAYAEGPSGMMVSATDITLTTVSNTVTSSTTNFTTAGNFGGFNTTDTYWIWTSAAQYGPLKFSSISANSMVSSVALSSFASGTTVRIMRVPASGDKIMMELNDGTYYATTTSGAVTLPTFTGTWDIKGALSIPITAGPPSNVGYASTDNGRKLYYFSPTLSEFGWAIDSGTGTITLANDRANIVQAADGLGYVSPNGLCFALVGAASGATTFSLGQNSGGSAVPTKVSAYARLAVGVSAASIVLKSHAGGVSISNSTWQRVEWSGTAVNNDTRATFVVAANTTLYVLLPQVEQSSSTATRTTPIVNRGAATTRTLTRAQRAWNSTLKNNITRSITWTPSQGPLTQKQTLWSLYADASNYLELSITNTTVTFRKRRGGTNYDVTASYTPVAGTAVTFTFGISQTAGVTLSINGTAATPNTTDLADITALTSAAVEDIGTLNGGTGGAYGSFKSLGVS